MASSKGAADTKSRKRKASAGSKQPVKGGAPKASARPKSQTRKRPASPRPSTRAKTSEQPATRTAPATAGLPAARGSGKQAPAVDQPPPPRPSGKQAPARASLSPRPLRAYRSGDQGLDAVLLPLLARSEPGSERPLDLEHARARLIGAPQPSDAPHLVALLDADALDLGAPLPPARPAAAPPAHEERQERARRERERASRLDYVSVLLAAACLHEEGQARVAEILREPHDTAIKERAALQITASPAPLSGPLEEALRGVLAGVSEQPLAAERNLLSNAARALVRHLQPARALEALRPHLTPEAVAQPGGVARAQMILTDLDTARLDPGFRPVVGALLRDPSLASFACDVFAGLPPDPADAALAAAALAEQLDRKELPDGYLIWLLARAPHPGATASLLRLLDAGHDPDWAVILDGLKRADDPSAAEPLMRWIERHRKLTGRGSSWEGFEAARALIRHLTRSR